MMEKDRLYIDEDDVVTEIVPGILISGFPGAMNYKKLHPETRLLDVRGLIAIPTANREIADACALVIHAWKLQLHVVLVHCQAGAERAPFTVAYYLSKHTGITFNAAWQLVASKRHCAIPTVRFQYVPKGG